MYRVLEWAVVSHPILGFMMKTTKKKYLILREFNVDIKGICHEFACINL